MQDIETITTKLLKGLASMKNIITESMGSEELRAEEVDIINQAFRHIEQEKLLYLLYNTYIKRLITPSNG